jgi:hypothetical protein
MVMKIDIYSPISAPTPHYQVAFNDLEYVSIESINDLHKIAYKWLNKKASIWRPNEESRKAIQEHYTLVATLYVTSIKEIPTTLKDYPELLF